MICILPNTFAVLTPVKSVEIKSEKLDYDEKTPGAWKVTKSAKWTGKGEAEVTFEVDSKLKNRSKNTDIVLVLDISASMEGRKIERVQKDSIDLLNELLDNNGNKAALITFSDSSSLISGFTNDKESLISYISNITLGENTNYYNALVNVDKVLKNYRKEDERECIVLFLTDGWPNRGIPNEVGQYNYLKRQYPYAIINGIQYEMGDTILEQLIRVTDNQFVAYVSTLSNVLTDASVVSKQYEKFDISDFIDTRYFYVDKASDIKVEDGKINFDKDNQKIDWIIDEFSSGKSSTMTIKIKLKDELLGAGGVYPTNIKEEISSNIGDESEDVISEDTPILADNYKVIYDGNAPNGCSISNVPIAKNVSVYDTVEVSDNVPKCDGYYFRKWNIVNKNVDRLNDDYFIMPEEDVTLRAVWKKMSVKKSIDGELAHQQTLYEMMADNSVLDDRASEFVTADTGIDFNTKVSNTNGKGIYEFSSKKDDKYPVYYYRGDVENNLKFANFCWKIVRTTDTGGVKLIYNGVPNSNGYCNNTGNNSFISVGAYGAGSDIARVGYMYGIVYPRYAARQVSSTGSVASNFGIGYIYGNDVEWDGSKYILKDTYTSSSGWRYDASTINTRYHYSCFSTSSSCTSVKYIISSAANVAYYYLLSNGNKFDVIKKEMFSNTNDSEIKSKIDTWYENNMTGYTRYLEDTVWCNDRRVMGSLEGKDESFTSYNVFKSSLRVSLSSTTKAEERPSIKCFDRNDSFTVNKENGNGDLKYPVATLTVDEANMAGAVNSTSYGGTNGYYLFGGDFWTISPYQDNMVYIAGGTWNGSSGHVSLSFSGIITSNYIGIRPSISLAPGARVSEGDGSVYEPFVVDLSSFK